MFEEEIQDELGHAIYLTDVTIDLGGGPTTTPKEFPKPEGLKAMLELDLEMEKDDVENYMKHVQLAFLAVQMLFVPCIATVAVMRQEMSSWRWTLFNVALLFVISFGMDVAIY
jgi:Fe2+ transport system protein B